MWIWTWLVLYENKHSLRRNFVAGCLNHRHTTDISNTDISEHKSLCSTLAMFMWTVIFSIWTLFEIRKYLNYFAEMFLHKGYLIQIPMNLNALSCFKSNHRQDPWLRCCKKMKRTLLNVITENTSFEMSWQMSACQSNTKLEISQICCWVLTVASTRFSLL